MKTIKTTKKHFELFKKECERWIKFFGLIDWRIEYELQDLPNDYARIEADLCNKWADIWLADELPKDVTTLQIKRSAFHEVCHLLSYGLQFIFEAGINGQGAKDVRDREMESFCRRLENSVFKKLG